MLYRENGQFKTTYRADQQIFPITQDRIAIGLMLLFGMALLISNVQLSPLYMKQGWLHTKFLLVALLFGYFIYCGILSKKIAAGSNTKTSKWMRLFNEVPAAFLIAIIALVVVKPF